VGAGAGAAGAEDAAASAISERGRAVGGAAGRKRRAQVAESETRDDQRRNSDRAVRRAQLVKSAAPRAVTRTRSPLSTQHRRVPARRERAPCARLCGQVAAASLPPRLRRARRPASRARGPSAMPRPRPRAVAGALTASLLAALPFRALAFDSRNVSAAQWACSPATAMAVSFAASGGPPGAVGCGAEVLWAPSQAQPTFGYAAADASGLYTLLLLDRDAPNAAEPVRSPLIHMALADVPGGQLGAAAVTTWRSLFPFSGPRPPAGTLCHRYYFQLYEQSPAVAPQLNVTAVGRFSFNFPAWADANNLTRVPGALTYFQTQNDTFRVGPCAAEPSPAPQSGAAPALPATGAALALALAAAAALATGRAA